MADDRWAGMAAEFEGGGVAMAAQITRKVVEEALAAEAAELNVAHGGTHAFDPIRRVLRVGCNWSASFQAVRNPLPLDEMRGPLGRRASALSAGGFPSLGLESRTGYLSSW
jgi:hypothetical protein